MDPNSTDVFQVRKDEEKHEELKEGFLPHKHWLRLNSRRQGFVNMHVAKQTVHLQRRCGKVRGTGFGPLSIHFCVCALQDRLRHAVANASCPFLLYGMRSESL